MIKLLVLCLLATLVTMRETGSKSSDSSTTTKTSTSTTTTTKTTTTTTPKTTTTAEHKASLLCQCDGGPSCDKGHCTAQGSKPFCVMMAENNTLGLSQSVSAKNHTCGDSALSDLCNTTISITLSDHHYWRSCITCCHDRDNCNSQSPKAPPSNTTLSKLVCPSCFKLHDSTCTPTTKKCAANETKCISVTGTVKNGDNTTTFAGQGCATPSAKNIDGTTLVFDNAIYHFTTSTFRDATDGASQTPGSVPFTILLTSFVGLLQAKLIY